MPETKIPDDAPADDASRDELIDEQIAEDLDERQQLDQVGREVLRRRLREHTSESPKLAAGDVDAAWDMADGGEETVGGDAPTPDQNEVDQIGEAAGLSYQDDEPLNYAKITARDQHRWELNPASAAEVDQDEPGRDDDNDLDELGLLDDDVEDEAVEIIDVDDLADELDEDEAAGAIEEDELEDPDDPDAEDYEDDDDEDDDDEGEQ